MIRRSPWWAAAALAGLMALSSGPLLAYQSEVESLKSEWESVTTELRGGERRDALSRLADQAEALAGRHANQAEVLVWQGIILASYARERSGLGALGSARSARDALERAVELDPQGGNGSAYVTLGALYDRAPGRPLGFGNSNTAEQMFQRALEIRPDGIDVNFYYAAFLHEEGRLDEAREHAQRAVEGEARPDREASDEALRVEARTLLSRLT
ncbi:TRAP transporter TatT component family protein [Franzmannia qiaohouensis]|uniref:TRAP transporter TatT component family protein n=1 Tax=Franzmannia qiaohouensis TaxID=1329370 RepID=A0ABU1HCC6_9GAMM|nr:TRAP transporter TatT component family protein [Halomonas qiaohouensis]MDR5904275.1 TRAP transporter TatT component family protein [Halomonas qiaohouensis]